MAAAEIGAGDLKITLDGEEVTLKPSLEACLAMTRAPGGIYGAGSVVDRLLKCDLDTMAMIVRAGLGIGPSAVKDLEAKIYRTGLIVMRDQLSEFVGIVANGGRKPEPDDEDEGEGEGDDERPQTASA